MLKRRFTNCGSITKAQSLLTILHPDGEIPLFNDSELDGARAPESLLASASTDLVATAETDPSVTLFPHTGYGIIRSAESRSALVFGLVAHWAPITSRAMAIVTFSATSCRYMASAWWWILESAPTSDHPSASMNAPPQLHNTVRIDGEDQAEVWASFRVGRRPRVGKLKGGSIGPYHFLRGEHYGYERRGVVHARQIMLGAAAPGLWWSLLKGKGHHLVESFIHLHSGVQVRTLGEPLETGECAPQHRWLLDFAPPNVFPFNLW